MSERNITLNAWDGVYLALDDLERQVARVMGGRANKLCRILGEARLEAVRIAPPGWLEDDVIPVRGASNETG